MGKNRGNKGNKEVRKPKKAKVKILATSNTQGNSTGLLSGQKKIK